MKNDKDTECARCGCCCHLDMVAYVSLEDIRRWEAEGRDDIIAHVRDFGVEWSGDAIKNRFESKVRTCRMTCVYLDLQGPLATCTIHDTRTNVCRAYVAASSDLCAMYKKEKE